MDNLDVSEASWRAGNSIPALVLDRAGGDGLKEIGLVIAAGEQVAIVGPTGGAADALFSWLRGAAKPGRGRILVGGQPVRGGPAAFWEAGVRWPGAAPKRFGLRPAREGAVWLRLVDEGAPAIAEDDEAILARRADLPSAGDCPRIAMFDAVGKVADDTPAALRRRFA